MRFVRAVSPLKYESAVPTSTDVIYETDNSSEDDSEGQEQKRRRIEEHGTRYLQGLPVYIMSARLKGPFDNSWKNPWQRSRRSTHGGRSTVKSRRKQDPAIPETIWRDLPKTDGVVIEIDQSSRLGGVIPHHVNEDAATSDITWLRKDRALESTDTETHQRSPSPTRGSKARHLPIMGPSKDESSEKLTELHSRMHRRERIAKKSVPEGPLSITHIAKPMQSNHVPGIDLVHKDRVDNLMLQSVSMIDHQKPQQHRKPRRMDFASSPALHLKPMGKVARRHKDTHNEHQQQLTTDQVCKQQSQKPSLDARNSSVGKLRTKTENLDGTELKQCRQLQFTSHVDDHSMKTSGSANITYSAQLVPQAIIPARSDSTPSIEPIPTTASDHPEVKRGDGPRIPEVANIDDSILDLSTQAAVTKAQEKLRLELTTTRTPGSPEAGDIVPSPDGHRSKDGIKLFRALNNSTPTISRRHDDFVSDELADTQAMLGAITPFALDTVKTKGLTAVLSKPSTAGTRPRQKKRASFAPTSQDSSSSIGSIKSCLKVTKPTSSFTAVKGKGAVEIPIGEVHLQPGQGLHTSPPSVDINSDLPNGALGAINGVGSQANDPSGLSRLDWQSRTHPDGPPLISTAPFSTLNTAQLSEIQQEAQPVPVGQAVEKDSTDDFDLSAAMDDVGSFLQSWDAEKEMRSLGAAIV